MTSPSGKRKPTSRGAAGDKGSRSSERPRDWLEEYGAKAGLDAAALESVREWLAEQLVSDEFARLGQGGYTEVQVPLRRVFVDLPITHEPAATSRRVAGPTLFLDDLHGITPVSLYQVCQDSTLPGSDLDDESSFDDSMVQNRIPGSRGKRVRRLLRKRAGTLLIGGPGQGKSTLSQLACQLHRVVLLQTRTDLPSNVLDVLRPFQEMSEGEGEGLRLPAKPLFPLRVVLPAAASWLAGAEQGDAGAKTPALLRFLASQPSARKANLTAETLGALIAHMPFLLVLDGFDEIGAAEDREKIVAATRELLGQLAARDARAVVVATTRPQGYAGELARIGVRLVTRHLAQLDIDAALHYAHKLVQAKIQGADSQETIMARLREAAEETATAHLLRTPLQVTILAALVQQGAAPSERWSLFWRYFDFTYRREIEHDTYASRLLATQRVHIEAIHRRVALLMQVEAENAGGAAARMTRERLHSIVDAVLTEDEIPDERRADLTQRIVDAAERRLVFLVEPEPGSFGFEIRSLQEFMAAWALTEGREAAIEERFIQVAKAPLFRHVVLFMASRFFSQRSVLRDVLAERICGALDEDTADPLARITRAGSLLALEVLEEGSSSNQPKRACALMKRAVELLDLPPDDEHRRLALAASNDTVEVLRAAIEKRLASGSAGPGSLAAWFCLLVSVRLDHAFARDVAEKYWASLDEPEELLRACGWRGVPLSPWLAEKIEAAPHLFTPEALLSLFGWQRGRSGAGDWLHALSKIRECRLQGRKKPYIPLQRKNRRSPWAGLTTMQSPPPRWRVWVAAARFHCAPSAALLAEVLRVAAEAPSLSQWRELTYYSSWPLAAALYAADGPDDLQRFADLAAGGELGDANDWYQAQDGWNQDVSARAVIDAVVDGAPWTRVSLAQAPPLVPWGSFYYGSAQNVQQRAFLLELAGRAFEGDHSASFRRRLADLCLRLWQMLLPPSRDENPPAAMEEWTKAVEEGAWSHTTKRRINERFSAMGARSRRGELIDAEKIRELIQDMVAQPGMQHFPWPMLLDGFVSSDQPYAFKEEQLIRWHEALDSADGRADLAGLRAFVINAMREVFHKSRRSGLGSPATWDRLGLPLPHPAIPPAASRLGPLPKSPVALQELQLRHVRGIHKLDLQFAQPAEEAGQWIVFLGPNGAGKTTLLRSLVLALRNLSDPKIWPKGTFATPYLQNHGPGEAAGKDRQGPGEAIINVQVTGRGTHTTNIRSNGSESFTQAPRQERASLVPLFAYGCRRGSALGGAARAVDLGEDDGPEVATLFDEGAPLIHAESWLIRWDGDALKNPRSKEVYEAIRHGLRTLLDVADIEVRDQQVWISQAHGPDVLFEALSDGYITTAGWFLDLIARWIPLARRYGVPVNADFMSRMTGLVLVDEIDLHLHPRWQIEVIGRIRRLLPRMSFVVTTHNPLTLVGARPEEIWILSLEKGRVTAERGRETPMLLTGGQIYSRYFGIHDLYPHELGRKLQRYGFLSGYALRDDQEQSEMEALREELARAGIDPGWEDVPRESPPPVSPAKKGRRKTR